MNGKKTVELSLKEFLVVLLRKWLILFVCALIAAGAFGAKTFVERRDDFKELYRRYQVNLSAFNQEVSSTEEAIRYNTLKQTAQESYNKNSVLMQVDPFNVRMAHLTFVVSAEGTGNLDSVNRNIASVYRTLIASAPVSEIYKGIDSSKYTVDNLLGLIVVEDLFTTNTANTPPNLINVNAIGNEDIDPVRTLENLAEYLNQKKESVAATTAAHQLSSVGARSAYESNDSLSVQQNEKRAALSEATQKIKDLEDELEKIRGRKPNAPSLLRHVAKQGLIAAVVMAILAAFVLILIYAVQIQIQTADQIQAQLGLRYLGGGLHKKGKLFGRWGDYLSGVDKLSSDPAVRRLVEANVKEAVCGKFDTVLLTGTVSQEALEAFASGLEALCGENTIKLIAQADIVNNALAVEALEAAQAVILVECIGDSKLKRVYQCAERARQSGKQLIGYTLI